MLTYPEEYRKLSLSSLTAGSSATIMLSQTSPRSWTVTVVFK